MQHVPASETLNTVNNQNMIEPENPAKSLYCPS